ncbi:MULTISPECIES: hypothetical protein [unclassified Mesorhizobium]|uniref:hypothetical protein n=1 Tax=unclassified Mesorhizobium TaxID=325217 RepID=UPI001091A2DE|nr:MULTISPECIES: hypothetical protein [unclassified Mesorhizobium]TIX17074.1 MAG: hypothetical protein E5V46_00260 [Mesorhizobium sp.]TGQ43714.1 hypothetical protein EN857_06390 [Mesorhizobium sp. M4B.F.Ca.ET.214.01.1.1]TGQ62529.1 hypothetical protein EN854_06395 [Mesorhizobium sp. M4B.F.Ca.ET.211.01.1.1]TGS71768.1 hypothetical protein EN844_01940 [Mesorhizobium sp. M3A.F.Ca.ET.201.01.1.1]TGU39731.1 hypothetical protein EN793_06390 [Mesorhizobium sp. M4B.F.Ca.ET.150.01.1.1]
MSLVPAGPYALPGVSMPSWLVRFDKDGQCTSPGTAAALIGKMRSGDYSSVLFYAHGWNTDFAAAVDQYSRFLRAFEAVIHEHPLPGFSPIFVGITWPSAWMPSTPGPQMAAEGDAQQSSDANLFEKVISEIASDISHEDRADFYELIDSGMLGREQALRLAAIVSGIISHPPEEVDGADGEPIGEEGILKLASLMRTAESGSAEEDIDIDEIGVVGGGARPLAAAGESWDPRDLIRLASLFQMKDRAGRVGSRGVATLLRDVLSAAKGGVHVFGHSFGSKVMLSALCAPEPLSRQPSSLLLLQPAISHLCFAETVLGRAGPGGYRAALSLVRSPVFTTYSSMDFPLHNVFHLALRRPSDLGELQIGAAGEPPGRYAALGGYGPRGMEDRTQIDPIPAVGDDYPALADYRIVALDGSDKRITSHGDVANSYTAWALRTQIARA